MTHGSLFSGIGGFDLAAQWAGIKNVFQVEIDKFCNKILEKNFPDVKRYGDIKQFDGTKYKGRVDIISGGFPCQPFSIAGKRRGKEDDRFLWDEMLRIITEIRPKWIVGENVANLWNMGFEDMLAQVEGEGYEVETFIIPALAVGAPHRRDRIWIVANNGYGNDERKANKRKFTNEIIKKETLKYKRSIESNRVGIITNTYKVRSVEGKSTIDTTGRNKAFSRSSERNKDDRNPNRKRLEGGGKESDRERSIRLSSGKNSGWNQNWYEVATEFCRVDDGVSNRVDRLKSLGNAVVPQIPFIIFESIKIIDNETKSN